MPTVREGTIILESATLAAASAIGTSTLHEAAGRIGALPSAIKPIGPAMRLCGRALPVQCCLGSNLALHHAIYEASAGDVIVADCGDLTEFGYWGEVMTVAAQERGIAGLVITGGIRDAQQIAARGFATFAANICVRGTSKSSLGNSIGEPIVIGEVRVNRGDLVLGDADGVVVLPRHGIEEVIASARRRDAEELVYLERLRAGDSTVAIYGLPDQKSDDAVADRAGPRRSIDVAGLSHNDLPIPAASRVGNLVATGGIRGVDRATGLMSEDLGEQTRNMFDNLQAVIAAAGAHIDGIVKLTIWVAHPQARQAINLEWVRLFPDPRSRPSRHILKYELGAGMLVQCEALALVADGPRENA